MNKIIKGVCITGECDDTVKDVYETITDMGICLSCYNMVKGDTFDASKLTNAFGLGNSKN